MCSENQKIGVTCTFLYVKVDNRRCCITRARLRESNMEVLTLPLIIQCRNSQQIFSPRHVIGLMTFPSAR